MSNESKRKSKHESTRPLSSFIFLGIAINYDVNSEEYTLMKSIDTLYNYLY